MLSYIYGATKTIKICLQQTKLLKFSSSQMNIVSFLMTFYEKNIKKLPAASAKKSRNKPSGLSNNEVITILLTYHRPGFRNFKHFYKSYVCVHLKKKFPGLASYNYFIELEKKTALHLIGFVMSDCIVDCIGLSFIDSTKLAVCMNQRINARKQFKGLAQKGTHL